MWTANLFQTSTGAIGPNLNFASHSWSISLNEIESLSMDLRKSDLPAVDLDYWLAPWWAGILLMWNGVPIFGGPIVSIPSEQFNTLRVECKGFRALFEHRYVIRELTDWALLSRDKIIFTGYSFGTIARRIVQQAMAKPGGALPVTFPIPEQTVTPDKAHEFTFSGYDLNNITADAILTQLSSVTNGPDIMFKPRLLDGNSVTFDLWYGSEQSPTLPQIKTPVWDTTAVEGEVTDLDVVTTGTYQANRVFGTGPGTNESLLIKVAYDPVPITKGFPLLESTVSTNVDANSGSAADALVKSRTDAALIANSEKLKEIQLTVRADGEHELGSFWPGDEVQLVVKGWRNLKDGTHTLRLLNINGSQDGNVRMSLQTVK